MNRAFSRTFGALVAVAAVLATAAPAGAQTAGRQTFKGVIVASGVSGTREVVTSVVTAGGAFSGIGRIVEIQSLPDDPENVSRDDLVFAGGNMHLVSTTVGGTFSLNPRTCVFIGNLQQTGAIDGGTGRFAAVTGSFTGTVTARGLGRRDPDGSCSQEQAPLHEVDAIAATGTLSY